MSRHVPVLLNEVLELLQLKPGMKVIDCTLGDAGHSEAVLERVGPQGKLLGIDADPESLLRAKQYLYRFCEQAIFLRDNFVHLKDIVETNNFGPVDAVLMDLGWSSPQFEERGRGFSFQKDEPLDMRYDPEIKDLRPASPAGRLKIKEASETAAEIVNSQTVDELTKIFKLYGEEQLSREIAEAIVKRRKERSIERTGDLVEIVLQVYREKLKTDKEIPWVGGNHPATKVFQALRIAVNREFEVLKEVLPEAMEVLAKGGRLAVITFHSLEDRIVKQYFKSIENKRVCLVNKKPIIATDEEVKNNPRARSAKLRVVEKLET